MITWLRRRVLPLFLVVVMLASYLPVSAFAEGEDTKALEVKVEQEFTYVDLASSLGVSISDLGDFASAIVSNGSIQTYSIWDGGEKIYPAVAETGNAGDLSGFLTGNPWKPEESKHIR